MKKILFIIRQFNVGGAQQQLINLATNLNIKHFEPYIISYYPGGVQEEKINKTGIKYFCLNKKGRYDCFFIFNLIANVKKVDPDIIYTFLSTSNFLSIILKPIFFKKAYIWSIRNTYVNENFISHKIMNVTLKFFSRFIPDIIIANSYSGKKSYVNYGYENNKIKVIGNGIDLQIYNYDFDLRTSFRKKFGYDDRTILIGIIGRFDENKGYRNFILASKIISKFESNCHFIIVGDGTNEELNKIKLHINELNMNDKFLIESPLSNLVGFYNGVDIITSASVSEGTSNVLLEALACNTHCIATDVGDNSRILIDNEYLFSPNDNNGLANCWAKKIQLIRKNVNENFRSHVKNNYS